MASQQPPAPPIRRLCSGRPTDGCSHIRAGRFKLLPKAEVEAAPAVDTAMEEDGKEGVALPAALEPKVMAPFDTPAGDVPRRVQIERKKRLYAAHDVAALLEAEGVNSLLHQPSGLELSYFDDREYDSRTFDEWTLPDALEKGVKCKVRECCSRHHLNPVRERGVLRVP